ncbi:MAG: polymerase [Treponema sp.]|jgi:hypothetical protein|nr:polymerase [Treponema sp.]
MKAYLRAPAILVLWLTGATLYAQSYDISGSLNWDSMEIEIQVSLDLASAGIRLPTGRSRAEELLDMGYASMSQSSILSILIDSSATLGEKIGRGEISVQEAASLAASARKIPPTLSQDMSRISAAYTIDLSVLSSRLMKHSRPTEPLRPLSPVPGAAYTGIIIIANRELPIHGRAASTLVRPCLFPRIWDSDMTLIYEKTSLDPDIARSAGTMMVRYVPVTSILSSTPSGLEPGLAALVGNNPLRIMARGVFGVYTTDPVIDREDALLLLSIEETQRHLREGRVAIVLDDSVLRAPFK